MSRTILICLFGDLGDTVLTVPAVRALRERFSDGRIVLLAKPGPAAFVERLGLIDAVIPVDKHAFDSVRGLVRPANLLALARLLVRLRRERADTAVIFGHLVTWFGTAKYALLILATGARERVGLDNGRGWFLNRSIVDCGFGAMHESEYWLRVAGLLGAFGQNALEAPVSEADRSEGDRLLALARDTAGPIVAFHPGTGWYGPGRRWEPKRFADVANQLRTQTGAYCVIVGSGEDRAEVEEMIAGLNYLPLNLVDQTSVGQLAAVLGKVDLLVANDGGVGHLAAAVGTPVISIFGPSNDTAWRPLTATVVAADLPCRPCFYRDFDRGLPNGCGTRQCMQLVSPKMVVSAAVEILDKKRGSDV